MFDLFRSKQKSVRLVLGALLLLVALSMITYLIPGGPGTGGSRADVVAEVGNDKVTVRDVQVAVDRITRQSQGIPKALLAMYVPQIINQLVTQKALAYEAKRMGLQVSDAELASVIQAQFSQLSPNGQLDQATYRNFIEQQGMTVPEFESNIRSEMTGIRLETIALQSIVVTPAEIEQEYKRKNEKVGLQYVELSTKNFTSKVSNDPAALKAYFEKNRESFKTQPKRSFVLVVANTADFAQAANISDQDLQKQYQANIDQYRVLERVNVRHILIKTQGKPKEEEPKLREKAEGILKQLKSGANFAELAKKDSEDPGSGQKGGELGWIARGQTVPAFEKAAFSLKPNELSNVIATEYGFHILQITSHEQAHTRTFDEVKPELLAEQQKSIGQEKAQQAVEQARAEILRTPAQAEVIAKKHNLKAFKVDQAVSGQPLPEIGSSPEISNTIFSAQKGEVSQVGMTQSGKIAFAAITDVIPARNAEYAEVEKDVRERYTTAEAERLLRETGQGVAAKIKQGETLAAIAKQYGASVKTASPFTVEGAAEGIGPGRDLAAAFDAKVGDTIGPVNVGASAFICKVSEKVAPDMDQLAKTRDSLIQSVRARKSQEQDALFKESITSALIKQKKVKLYQDVIDRIKASYSQS